MILRFTSKDGMFRLQADTSSKFDTLVPSIMEKISASNPEDVKISFSPITGGEATSTYTFKVLSEKSIGDLGLKNGSMIYLSYDKNIQLAKDAVNSSIKIDSLQISGGGEIKKVTKSLFKQKQLPIDDALDREDGLIKRSRSNMCRHGEKGMCEYCQPLPPWDLKYLAEHNIKHKSFHAHVKELNEQKNNPHNSSSYMAPLEELDYEQSLDPSTGRRKGPAVITLKQQQFRMVDHVEVADFNIMNNFIDVWRKTGVQRIGYMYGRYEKYEGAPLGVKAVVEAIYEPPQTGETDGLTLLPWENESEIDEAAFKLGLYRVGVIFTDLTDSGLGNGTVLCKRHKDTYFLSCLEVLFAAKHQLKFPNWTKHSNSGKFSSKFVTCVISGGLEGEIEPKSYQVSLSGEALVKADIVSGTTHPSQLYVNDDGKTPVPDIYYSEKNEYGLEVKTNAKPTFPVDFLLVSLSDSFPLEPKPKFVSNFTIENREFLGELQEFKNAYRLITESSVDGSGLRDFHFILYLMKLDVLNKNELEKLFAFINSDDKDAYYELIQSPGWMTLLTILEQSS